MYGFSGALAVSMNGFLAILIRNHVYALSVTALIGKNPVRARKKGWSRVVRFEHWLWLTLNNVELMGIKV